MSTTIHKAIEIKAPIEHVWRYIGTEAGLRQWLGSDIRLDAKQGGRCAERSLFNGKPLYLAGEVKVYTPPHQLILEFRREEEPEAWPAFTVLSITLKENGGRTLVTLEHQAFGALTVEQGNRWAMPTIPATKPARQVVSNQLPAVDSSARNTAVMSPNITSSTAGYALQDQAAVWFREGATRWDYYFDHLKQIVSAA
ncbi:hypothetical protein BH10CHL1_BH10CHL1_03670 [soil metagenome]